MISGPFPAELEQLVQAELAAGDFKSPADMLLAEMRLLHESREFERLKAEVQLGIDQAARGEYTEYDKEGSQALLASLKARAMRNCANGANKP